MNKEDIKPIAQFSIILLIGSGIVLGTSFVVNLIKKPEIEITKEVVEIEKIIKAPECKTSFDGYKEIIDNGQFVILLENRNMYALDGEFINDTIVEVNRSGDDIISCGYLYLEASTNGHELDKICDSVYINPNGFGGHILRSKSFKMINEGIEKTIILIPLSSVSYLQNVPYNPNAQDYKIANWVNLLNTGNRISFNIGLSSLNQNSYINKIVIAYKCWNPDTGEETQNCQLGLDK